MLKTSLAIVAGLIVGSIVNSGLVHVGPMVIPVPEGADVSTMEGLAASMSLFQAKHFLFPFLAHALGTLAGAFVTARFAAEGQARAGWIVGCFFLLGGIAAAYMIPAPLWFEAADLALAYLPMAWLGIRLAGKDN